MNIQKHTAVFMLLVLSFLFVSACAHRDPVTYCGEQEENGPWDECNPDRYNVDGPAERLLNKGVSRILMIDLTVGGPRFSKTFDVVQMTKRAMAAWEQRQNASSHPVSPVPNKIGIIYVVHGGFTTYRPQYLWDASVQMFAYDPNHPVFKLYLFNKNKWHQILKSEQAQKELKKYSFSYERIGGSDPFQALTERQLEDMKQELTEYAAASGTAYEVDWACWMCGDIVEHYAYPRYLYNPPEETPCSTDIPEPHLPLVWVNDPANLMEQSYPTKPACWTKTLGAPDTDTRVDLTNKQNPIVQDISLAQLQVEAIEASFSPSVPDNATGILLLNHAINDNNECFDPKIDDTLVLNKNIKTMLLQRHPTLHAEHIIGAYMGIKELNPENNLVERTRPMRGEDLGYAWLYESDKQMPGDEWGYRYWDALDYLKNSGVRHIVIGFPQIITDSVLNLVEIHNQIAKEIGYKTWLGWNDPTLQGLYPATGNPFADYWGIWVDTTCGQEACCFEMGGCNDGRQYPPPRQTPLNQKRGDRDPSLAYEVSEYGHLGYDAALGPPNPTMPVQNQYTGTWALYRPPNDDPRIGELLAAHVENTLSDLVTSHHSRKPPQP